MAKFHPTEQLVLSNGIPVILQHSDTAAAATYWWVRAGSADERPSEEGFAHFLEHMLFKDAAAKETGVASSGQLARAIESLGGDINAYTSFDQTVYHVTCASHHWEKVIEEFGAMAKPQRFLKSDFEREREVILEELRKNEDSPGRQLFQSLFTATFKKHPYGRPVIGFVKTLKDATVGTLEAFYRRQYVSGKMGLILVGPLDDANGERKKSIMKSLERHFGSRAIPKKEGVFAPRVVESALRSQADFRTVHFDVKTPTLSISFRVPELNHADIPAIDLLSGILGMGELSRLYQKLFYEMGIVSDTSGGLYVPKDPGMIYFMAEADSVEKLPEIYKPLFAELVRIQNEGPTPEELARVLANAESERLYATQTADGTAGRLGFLKYIMGDLEFDRRYIEDLKEVDSERIRQVAREYLHYGRMAAVVMLPKDQAKAEHKFDIQAMREEAQKQLPVPVKEKAVTVKKKKNASDLPIEYFTLPSGIRVAFNERSHSHVFSIHASVLGGLRLELAQPFESKEKDWGVSHMMSLTWTKGTSRRSAREISSIVEGAAAGLDGFSGRNSVGLALTGLNRDWTKLSDLFSEVLIDPAFPDSEVAHSKRVALDSLRSLEDHTSQLCSKLFLETLFENHPYGRITLGSMESVEAMSSAKLKAFHRAWIRPERLSLAISGAIRRPVLELWLKQLDERLTELKAKSEPWSELAEISEESDLVAPRWVERALGREQTHILVGGLGTRVHGDDRYDLRLLQNILGGQSGRLFIELREKKSLAYTVAPTSFEGVERGYVGTYIACSPSKKQEALEGIAKVLETLAAKGPTSAEMDRAREFFLGRRAMDLQSDSAIASSFGLEQLYGIQHLGESELAQRIRKISGKDIQRICKKYLIEPHRVTSVVG